MQPLVVVIENPDEDPTVLAVGNVEIVELSLYPISRYGGTTDFDDTGYEEECRNLLARIVETYRPTQRAEAEEHLQWMLDEIIRRKREYGAHVDERSIEMTFEIGDKVTTQFDVMMGTPVHMIVMSRPRMMVRVFDQETNGVTWHQIDELIRVED